MVVKYYTIYCHTHVETGRRYIGLTSQTMEKRWSEHVAKSNHSKDGRWHFANAIRKYGKDAFSHEVLAMSWDLEGANATEEQIIEQEGTRDPKFGFNLMRGGQHIPHPKSNPWDRPGFREKVSASMKTWYENPVNQAAKSAASREVLSRPEVRAKLSAATSSQFSSVESRIHMSGIIRALHQDPGISSKFMKGFKTANQKRASKTHCVNGHEFTPKNTQIDDNGWRYCRQCRSDRVSKKEYNSRTYCVNGHEFSGGNIKFSKNGRSRICLKCLPTHCKRGHQLSDKPGTFSERGCYKCKLERARVYDAARRQKRRKNNSNLSSII